MSRLVYILFINLMVATTTIGKKQLPRDENENETEILETELWVPYWIIVSSLIAIQATILYFLGQPIISRSGVIRLWCGEVQGSENSQHVTDWYTFSHIIHGLIYYWFLGAILPSAVISMRFLLAVVIEIVWEVLENSPMVINRYRQTAISNGYSGDSILNSVSDTLAMSFGFYLASSLPAWLMVTFAISAELLCAYTIRDNLTLNVIQLIYPLEAVSRWQTNL